MTNQEKCPFDRLLHPDTYTRGVPIETYNELCQQGAVVKLEDAYSEVPYWAILDRKHADIVSKRSDLFSAEEKSTMVMEFPDDVVALLAKQVNNMDPPRHIKFRKILRSIFTIKAVDSYEPLLRNYAEDIVAKAVRKGSCEFVREISAELPLITILELMGIPVEEREQFYRWTNTMIWADDPIMNIPEEDIHLASAEILGYGFKLAEQHREHPTKSIVGAMLDGSIDGEKLDDEEFSWTFLLLIIAGNETTRNALSLGMNLFIQYPDQYELLRRKPDLVPNAVEEILRYAPPVHGHRRTAKEDTELGGQQIKKGDKVVMYWNAVNRDEKFFPDDGNDFIIDRDIYKDGSYHHRTFGFGEHFCLGSHLARMELRLMLEQIVKSIANPRLDEPVKYVGSYLMNAISEMKLSFDPVA